MNFWEELKRRRVVRVTIAYVVIAFGAVEGADAFVSALHLPPQTATYTAVAALIGLPVTLILAWMFQITPSGITRDDGTTAPALWPLKRTVTAIVIVAGAGLLAFVVMPHAKRLDPKRVMVATFADRTGDKSLAAVGSMAAEWITQGIVQATLAEVVDPAALAGDPLTRARTRDGVSEARANGVGTVISGSYYKQGDSLYINAKLTDANTGDVITSIDGAAGAAAEPVAAVKLLRDRVLTALAAAVGQGGEVQLMLASRLPTYEAYRAYADAFNEPYQKRVQSLNRAVALDSTFEMARIIQVWTYAMLRDFPHSDSVIRVLDAKRDQLTPVEAALFARHRAFSTADIMATYVAAKELSRLMPGSRTAALEALRINHPREAIAEAERVPEGVRRTRFAAYYAQVSAALHMLEDYRAEARLLQQAHKYHADHDDWPIVEADVRALAATGRPDDARVRIDEAASLPRDSDRYQTLLNCALELRAHGYAVESQKWLDQLVAELASLPANRMDRRTRAAYEDALYYSGHDKAIHALVDSARTNKTAPFLDPALLGMYGAIAARNGNRSEAIRVMEQLKGAVYDSMPNRFDRVVPTIWRARIAARLGDKQQALDIMRENLRFAPVQNSTIRVYTHIDPDLASLAGWKPFDDLMKPKG